MIDNDVMLWLHYVLASLESGESKSIQGVLEVVGPPPSHRAAIIEECALVCDEYWNTRNVVANPETSPDEHMKSIGADDCSRLIRALAPASRPFTDGRDGALVLATLAAVGKTAHGTTQWIGDIIDAVNLSHPRSQARALAGVRELHELRDATAEFIALAEEEAAFPADEKWVLGSVSDKYRPIAQRIGDSISRCHAAKAAARPYLVAALDAVLGDAR